MGNRPRGLRALSLNAEVLAIPPPRKQIAVVS
jgi:hypothetical protein